MDRVTFEHPWYREAILQVPADAREVARLAGKVPLARDEEGRAQLVVAAGRCLTKFPDGTTEEAAVSRVAAFTDIPSERTTFALLWHVATPGNLARRLEAAGLPHTSLEKLHVDLAPAFPSARMQADVPHGPGYALEAEAGAALTLPAPARLRYLSRTPKADVAIDHNVTYRAGHAAHATVRAPAGSPLARLLGTTRAEATGFLVEVATQTSLLRETPQP